MKYAVPMLLLTATLHAQAPGQQTIFGHWDYPPDGAVLSVSRGEVYFAGWAINCWAAQAPTLATVYYRTDDSIVMLGSDSRAGVDGLQLWPHLPRPDVQTALVQQGFCPSAPVGIGAALYFTGPIPLGTRYFTIFVSDPGWVGVFHTTRKLTIVP